MVECKHCKHWDVLPDGDAGVCQLAEKKEDGVEMQVSMNGCLITEPTFWCKHGVSS